MLALPLELAVIVGAGVVLLYQGAALYFAAQMPRIDPRPGTGPEAALPGVSVIVAARDEASDLGACLDGLLAQDYPDLEIVVVDGGSTDGTRAIAEARAPRVRWLLEPPLPTSDWVGKNWACDCGASATTRELLLFTDADVRYHPAAVRTTVEWMRQERADLVSLAPRVETVGFWERVVLPFYVQMVLTYFRAPRANLDHSRAAICNGQYWLTSRSAYARTGGHRAVRGFVLEDVRIAQLYRRMGLRLRFGWAPDLLTTRMYRNTREMFEGLLKNVHGTEFSRGRQVGFLVGLATLFWLPLGVLPLGLGTGSTAVTAIGAFLYVALFGKHVAFAHAIRAPSVYGLLFPVAVAFYVLLVAVSISRGIRGRPIVWKGREYAMQR